MFKRVKRKSKNSRDWRCFVNRVRYITNQDHPHHKLKKVVQAAVNFFCLWGQNANDFIESVHQAIERWKLRSLKKKGGGNPTEDVFFELVYSAPKGLKTTAIERAAIDQLVTAPFRDCPIRRGWHLAAWDLEEDERPENWKPIDDGHYLISARDNYGNATISSRFGDGKETLESWMRRMDEEICDMLNRSREIQYEPVRPIYLRNLGAKLGGNFTKLHEMIAHHASESVTRENLADVIEAMERPAVKKPGKMEPVAKVTNKDRGLADDKLVLVHFTGRKKANRYRIKKLLLEIAETQLDTELARPDGNDGEEGGAGGESGGGSGGMGAVTTAQPRSGSLESSAPVAAKPAILESDASTVGKVSKPASVPPDATTPVPAPAVAARPSLALAAPQPSPAKLDPAQAPPSKPKPTQPKTTPAASSHVPAMPEPMSPSSTSSVPAVDESTKPKAAAALQQAQAVDTVEQSKPETLRPDRKKPGWRPRRWDKNPTHGKS